MKNKYSMFSFDTLVFFLIVSLTSSVSYQFFIAGSGIDTIFVILIGSVIGLIPMYIYGKIIGFDENNNIIDNLNNLFPKTSLIFKIILIISTFLVMCISLREIASFINIYLLKNGNILIISALFLLLVIYITSKGFNTIVKTSAICFYLFVLISILSFLGTFNLVDLNNVKPLFTNSMTGILINSIMYSFLSTSPVFMLTIIKKKDLEKRRYLSSNFYKTYIFTSIFCVIEFVFTLGILGITLLTIYKYPSISIYKKISFLSIFERVESFFAIKFLFYSFFLLAVLVFFNFSMTKSLFKYKKKDNILLSIIFIVILFVSYFYRFNFYTYMIASYVLGIVIPIVIYIRMLLCKLLNTSVS